MLPFCTRALLPMFLLGLLAIDTLAQTTMLCPSGDNELFPAAPLATRSVDLNGDNRVNIVDWSVFAICYPSPPKAYDPRCDLNNDGLVHLVDLVIFARHYGH